jgi:hypothetical protein
MYSTVKDYPGAYAYFFKKAFDKFAELHGHKSGAHFTVFTTTEAVFKIIENKTNTTIPDDQKAQYQTVVATIADYGEPVGDMYLKSAALFGFPLTNQFVFTMIKTTVNTAQLGAEFVKRNGYRIESAYEYGKAAATQYIEQLTPFALELVEEIAIELKNHPELITVAGVTTIAGLQVYRNPQRLWDDLKELQDKFADFYEITMGKYNQILSTPKETVLKLYNVDPETKMIDERAQEEAQKLESFNDLFEKDESPDPLALQYKLDEFLKAVKSGAQYLGSEYYRGLQNTMNPERATIPIPTVNVFPGRGIDGKKKGFISQKSVPQRTDEFRVFGNKLINIGYLDRNTVSHVQREAGK